MDQAFHGDGELRSTLVVRQFMDLVDDEELDVRQMLPQVLSGEHDLQRFRRGYEHVRRELGLVRPFRLRSVAVAHCHAQVQRVPELFQSPQHIPFRARNGVT